MSNLEYSEKVNPKELMFKPDIFVAGLTASGKDTIANYLKSFYDYRKIRLAGTIKQVICEKRNISPEELEELKREFPEVREHHHLVSDYMTEEAALNRAGLIRDRKAFDFEIVDDKERQVVVCDVRTLKEAEVLFDNESSFYGIFLSRTTNEYKNSAHYTENNIFTNGQLEQIISKYGTKCIIVLNGGKYNLTKLRESITEENGEPIFVEFELLPTAEDLISSIDSVINFLIDESN